MKTGKPNRSKHRDWIYRTDEAGGIERLEAFFQGHGYDAHRHDTYAVGITLSGVQSFNYRRDTRHSVPGTTMIIHPDEIHDGTAGTADGFLYRIAYIQPGLLQQALGNTRLPFVKDGICEDPRLYRAARALLADIRNPPRTLERDELLVDLAIAVQSVSDSPKPQPRGDWRAARIAKEYLDDNVSSAVTLERLAHVSQRDRWSLCRDFRFYFGTSPYRYLTMRRLDLAKRLMTAGQSLAESSAIAGFSDQSHMTRQFAKTFGIPPAQWLRIQATAGRATFDTATGLPADDD